MTFLFTIAEEHVGATWVELPSCPTCGARGRRVDLASVIGRVQRIDVGKRVYDNGGVIQVENDQQLAARGGKPQ